MNESIFDCSGLEDTLIHGVKFVSLPLLDVDPSAEISNRMKGVDVIENELFDCPLTTLNFYTDYLILAKACKYGWSDDSVYKIAVGIVSHL